MQYRFAWREMLLHEQFIKHLNNTVHTKSLESDDLITKTNDVLFHWHRFGSNFSTYWFAQHEC